MFGKVLAALAQALDGARLPYMIIGGQAVLVHGEPRFTRDIDVTLAAGLDSLARILQLMRVQSGRH